MNERDASIIDQTLEFWQSRSKERLTRESARQIVANITGFFQVLAEWDAAQLKTVCTEQNTSKIYPTSMKQAVNGDCVNWDMESISEN